MEPDKALRNLRKLKKNHGWFNTEAAILFAWIDEIQKSEGITRDIFEIGCHHGKSTVLLGEMINLQKEKLCVCDIFSDQDENISRSGSGDLRAFMKNMTLVQKRRLRVKILDKNSITLTAEEIGQNYRFFHIDGGHNCDEAYSDLNLAAKTLINEGVIALDDPFRPEWPGVTEALIRFLDEKKDFRATIVGFNKLILIRDVYSHIYLKEIKKPSMRKKFNLDYPWYSKELPFNDQSLFIFYKPSYLTKISFFSIARKIYKNNQWLGKLLLRSSKPRIN
jgi:hypothetical protein